MNKKLKSYSSLILLPSSLKWRGRAIRYAPLILWIGVIFFLSSTQGAMQNTSRFVRPLLEWLFPDASIETLTVYHGYVRKFAHFAEYAALGFFAWRAFKGGNPRGGKDVEKRVEKHTPLRSCFRLIENHYYLASFALVVLIAAIDETNQSFNSARTGSIYDALLDTSGGAAALLFLWLLQRNSRR
jgi:VanZ family protein